MNSFRSGLIALIVFSLGLRAGAQDGWIFSAQPPIVISLSNGIHFTNTSDKTLHGITLSGTMDKTGQPFHKVIIDTIGPHKTVILSSSDIIEFFMADAAITCTGYSKPLPVRTVHGVTRKSRAFASQRTGDCGSAFHRVSPSEIDRPCS